MECWRAGCNRQPGPLTRAVADATHRVREVWWRRRRLQALWKQRWGPAGMASQVPHCPIPIAHHPKTVWHAAGWDRVCGGGRRDLSCATAAVAVTPAAPGGGGPVGSCRLLQTLSLWTSESDTPLSVAGRLRL